MWRMWRRTTSLAPQRWFACGTCGTGNLIPQVSTTPDQFFSSRGPQSLRVRMLRRKDGRRPRRAGKTFGGRQ
eukprot:10200312-Alexandrium_andersonii.AAC.1